MSTEGEYLEMVNDLKDQYMEMKERLSREIAEKNEEIRFLEIDNEYRSSMVFIIDQFYSTRPDAEYPRYTNTIPTIQFYHCYKCNRTHPNQSICYT